MDIRHEGVVYTFSDKPLLEGALLYEGKLPDGRPGLLKLSSLFADTVGKVRFRREIEAQAQLHHKGIVKCEYAGAHGEQSFYVMAKAQGDIRKLSQNGEIDEEAVLRAFGQVSNALSYVHQQGLVHRDVKADNILLGHDGIARLGDFGIVKLVDDKQQGGSQVRFSDDLELTLPGAAIGTFGYAPPESLESLRVGPKSDVYSLAASLYRELSGRFVFGSTSPSEMINRTLSAEEPSPIREHRPDLSLELARVIDDSLKNDPGKRPNPKEFSSVIGKVLGEPLSQESS